ncbi:MAG: hypothetical protein WAM53_07615 [Terrimicrobiaceae bacterium]
MQAIVGQTLALNLVFGTLVFATAARIYVIPKINEWKPETIMVPILLLHSLRHLGLMFLAEGAVFPGMPPQFAWPAAVGDLVVAIIAFLAIPVTLRDFQSAKALLWLFNILGTLDLIAAIALANIYGAPIHMGAAYWIPAFWVPSLLVTHYLVFRILIQSGRGAPPLMEEERKATGMADGRIFLR